METENSLTTDSNSRGDSAPQIEYPPLVKRFQSLFVDQLFIIVTMVLLSKLFSNESEESTGALRGILFISLFLIYEPLCMAFGCTMGNYVSGIRVRKFKDPDQRINVFASYSRLIVKFFLGIISFFTVTSNKHKRAIHDMAAGSIMVYTEKE